MTRPHAWSLSNRSLERGIISFPVTQLRRALSKWSTVWLQSATYVRWGLGVVRRAPGLYLLIAVVYATPALLAGFLPVLLPAPALWRQALTVVLPWITILLGAVVVMVAVGYHARGRSIDLARATSVAVGWVPRYLWTNVHTSLIFWAPVGLVFAARSWQEGALPLMVVPEVVVDALWWLVIAGLALYLHTRTLLAPFLAVHADLPGTLAALEAWRLGGQHFSICLATLIVGSLPVGLPLGLLAFGVLRLSGDGQGAAPDLAWALIQAVRPVLIAALYSLYRDLWDADQARQRAQGGLRVPLLVRAVLALTQPLPKLGRWE